MSCDFTENGGDWKRTTHLRARSHSGRPASFVELYADHRAEREALAVVQIAKTHTEKLLSYDAKTLDVDLARGRQQITGDYAAQYERTAAELIGPATRSHLVQETYLRAWRGFDRFEGRSSVRRWLYKIATTACLTALETRSRRPLPSGLGAPADDHRVALAPREPSVAWLQPAPDALFGSLLDSADPVAIVAGRAGVRQAFIAALQLLPARQRAVLTLRDVLAFRTAEVAEMLDTTTAAVDSTLRRARAHLAEVGPVEDDLAEPDDGIQRRILDGYVDAFTRADPDALVNLLRADVELEMPPIPTWFTGRPSSGSWRVAY